MSTPLIRIEGVGRSFGGFRAVDDVTLDVARGEFFALLGPSGCGKTTLLRMLAGLETPSDGRILIDGVDMRGVPPNRRPVNMVFQSYALFPHRTVRQNVAYGLRIAGTPARETETRVFDALELVQLGDLADRRPDQLSGGQRQRVALARALVMRPKVLLLDEPLSALDAKLRETMRAELALIQSRVGVTFMMVTHDQDEALAMASRCALMNKGVLQQVATPADLYEYPANRFVADFIGSINLFEGRLAIGEPDRAVIACPDLGHVHLDQGVTAAIDAPVWLGIRPEKIVMSPVDAPPPAGMDAIRGTIRHASYLGSETLYELELSRGGTMRALRQNSRRFESDAMAAGAGVWLSWHPRSPVVLLS